MRIGLVTNNENCIPLLYTLAAQKLQVFVFFSPSADLFVNQKIIGFTNQFKIPLTEEKVNDHDLYQWLQKTGFDICFVLGFNQLIDLKRLTPLTLPIFNIHFGPLPAYKGPVPVFWQLKAGLQKIGLAIHRLTAKFDNGTVVWAKNASNQSHYNYQAVNQLFGQMCVEGVFYILNLFSQNMPLPEVNTVESKPGYQKRPGLNDVLIDWQTMYAAEICNLVRACNPWNKGALSSFKGNEIKLLDARIVQVASHSVTSHAPGTIISDDDCLHINCLENQIISVNTLFFGEAFVPAYFAKKCGLVSGERLG